MCVISDQLTLMIVVALAIKLASAGPVLEKQTRIGRGGCLFQMLKFRTTMRDPQHAAAGWGRQVMLTGQFLRYTRIEALPQLVNVLRGEMSLIDPDARSPRFFD